MYPLLITFKCVKNLPRVSLIFLYILIESVSFMNSLTTSPWSFSTTRTSSGLAIFEIIVFLTFDKMAPQVWRLAGVSFLRQSRIGDVELNGVSRYNSAARIFQYSKQILKISSSSTSEMRTRQLRASSRICLYSWLFSILLPCSRKKVDKNKLRFWMKFCSSDEPFRYASFKLIDNGRILNQTKFRTL